MITKRLSVPISDMRGQTLTVAIDPVFTRRFWVRYRIALALIRLAGLVMRVKIDVLEGTND